VDCNANRLILEFNKLGIKDTTPDEAWKQLVAADQAKDMADIKEVSSPPCHTLVVLTNGRRYLPTSKHTRRSRFKTSKRLSVQAA